ncbi:hypothetical protein GP486_002031 [Trichoglossum hirsutum]|uniref:Solute carrier family 40 member n=1 Tax=Trichoglossum hirsutum TaxID=265104 RepID=A0A9P8LFJ3_9PEZI|nr:hypothetical protein GP486_002031 [Trichoglossum hirsutum]
MASAEFVPLEDIDDDQSLASADESASDCADDHAEPNVRPRLYISHFLSTWNSRLFEFGAFLFLASSFPGTLLPASLYALVRAASAILFSPAVGRWIDHEERLVVVRTSIVSQRSATVASCLGFLALANNIAVTTLWRYLILVALTLLACVEKLGAVMNLVAVERDWVVVIAGGEEGYLSALSAQMRRIDLFCKLLGPLAISLVDGMSTPVAIWVTLGLNITSVAVEYFAILQVYNRIPALASARSRPTRFPSNSDETITGATSRRSSPLEVLRLRSVFASLSSYSRHAAFLPSLCLSILYLTVLQFGGQMIVYLMSVGYTSTHVGLVRAASIAFEISSTFVAPVLMSRIGAIRAGLWFVSWQVFCIGSAVALFWGVHTPVAAGSVLAAGVILSRVGVWGFDLSVQSIVQTEVEAEFRGAFSSLETSLQNFFELLSYASTIAFSEPRSFRWPASMSALAVLAAGVLYAEFVRQRRGHLLHMSTCVGGKI